MKKLFENWKKYLNESEVADAADELSDALRKKAEQEEEEKEEQEERDEEQDAFIKDAKRKATEQEIKNQS